MHTNPKIDYLSRDYASFRTSLQQYAQSVFPEWQPASEGDFGMVMVELFSYMGDIISYYTDRAQFENYLPTATQRDSILNLAYMLGYVPYSGAPATGTVSLVAAPGTATGTAVPVGLQILTGRVDALDGPITFETTASASLPANVAGTAVPVSVPVREGATVSNLYLGASTGQPGQVFALPHTGVYRDSIRVFVEDVEGSLSITPSGGGSAVTVREWLQVDRMLGQDSNDRVFESRLSSQVTNVYFGDELTGAIPATGLKIYATYRRGVGALGNLAPGVVRTINPNGMAGVDAVRVAQDATGAYLSSGMSGGSDEESNQSIRTNAPRAFRSQERVVTKADFVSAALGTPGVQTADVVVGSATSVTLYITGPGRTAASPALKQDVLDRLKERMLAGVTATIGDPTFFPVDFGTVANPIQLVVTPGYSVDATTDAAKRAIAQLIGDLSAGEPLAASMIYEVLSRIDGVTRVSVPVFGRQGSGQTDTTMITPQPWEILTLGTITLSVV